MGLLVKLRRESTLTLNEEPLTSDILFHSFFVKSDKKTMSILFSFFISPLHNSCSKILQLIFPKLKDPHNDCFVLNKLFSPSLLSLHARVVKEEEI